MKGDLVEIIANDFVRKVKSQVNKKMKIMLRCAVCGRSGDNRIKNCECMEDAVKPPSQPEVELTESERISKLEKQVEALNHNSLELQRCVMMLVESHNRKQ